MRTAAAPPLPKIVALVRLVAALDEGRHDFEELKRRVSPDRGVGTRTLRRYLATLSDAGFPWYFDRESGRYRFPEGWSLRRVELSGTELVGLETLRDLGATLGGTIATSIGEISQRLTESARPTAQGKLASGSLHFHVPRFGDDAELGARFDLLRRAQAAGQSVRFAYVDKQQRHSRRHVDPYGFVFSGGRVYLVAFDRGRGARRVFALDAVSDPRIAPERFSVPSDFDVAAFAGASISGTIGADRAEDVVIRFAPVVARAAEAERVVREQSSAPERDGGLLVTYRVADPMELVRWSLKWGTEAEVVAPPHVRAMARDLVRELASRYGSGT